MQKNSTGTGPGREAGGDWSQRSGTLFVDHRHKLRPKMRNSPVVISIWCMLSVHERLVANKLENMLRCRDSRLNSGTSILFVLLGSAWKLRSVTKQLKIQLVKFAQLLNLIIRYFLVE